MVQDDDESDLDEVLYAAAQPTSLALSESCSTPTHTSSANVSTAATPQVPSETPSVSHSLARNSEQLGKKAKRTSESQKGFLKELKEMNVELQEQQFKHEQAMQENWAQFLDKSERWRATEERLSAEQRRLNSWGKWRKISRSMPSRCNKNHMDFMCMLSQKYGCQYRTNLLCCRVLLLRI